MGRNAIKRDMKTTLYIILFLLLLQFAACDHFEYSPNQTFDGDTPRDLNRINLQKLLNAPLDDTVTIAFVGDSQRFYDEVDKFVDKVNEFPSVDFTLLAGDISDFGLLSEFEWIHESFSRLRAPYFGVLGNHDVVANGEEVFTRMFGAPNYSFVYDSIKFVVHNTNGREYISKNVPDMQWLQNELKAEANSPYKYFVAVSHVPPTDGDFNPDLIKPYASLFASTPNFVASLHGHIHDHVDHYPYNDGVRYITSYAFSQNSFLILKFHNGKVYKQTVNY
jgi:3',5'-cyclic-AMP phosphodiesterase